MLKVNTYKNQVMEDEAATMRKVPFSTETMDKVNDLRKYFEDLHRTDTGQDVMYPLPTIVAMAVDEMHDDIFGEL